MNSHQRRTQFRRNQKAFPTGTPVTLEANYPCQATIYRHSRYDLHRVLVRIDLGEAVFVRSVRLKDCTKP